MLEDQSQTVYSQWKSYWDNQYRINTDNPLGKSLRETFFSIFCLIQSDIYTARSLTFWHISLQF
jgi:hypothetical protein